MGYSLVPLEPQDFSFQQLLPGAQVNFLLQGVSLLLSCSLKGPTREGHPPSSESFAYKPWDGRQGVLGSLVTDEETEDD